MKPICILSLIKPILKSVVASLIFELDKKLLLHGWRKTKIQVNEGVEHKRGEERKRKKTENCIPKFCL